MSILNDIVRSVDKVTSESREVLKLQSTLGRIAKKVSEINREARDEEAQLLYADLIIRAVAVLKQQLGREDIDEFLSSALKKRLREESTDSIDDIASAIDTSEREDQVNGGSLFSKAMACVKEHRATNYPLTIDQSLMSQEVLEVLHYLGYQNYGNYWARPGSSYPRGAVVNMISMNYTTINVSINKGGFDNNAISRMIS